jgi:hypothetical protein
VTARRQGPRDPQGRRQGRHRGDVPPTDPEEVPAVETLREPTGSKPPDADHDDEEEISNL